MAANHPPAPPAAALRALRDALAGLGQAFGYGTGENANTVLVRLGASHEDATALHEWLAAALPPAEDPR